MFVRSILATALALGASVASALILNTPSGNLVAGETMDVSWQSIATDPSQFTLFLLESNNLPFGLAADFGEVSTAPGSAAVTLPGDLTTQSYQLRAVNSTNVDQVFASSADFVITAA
ncbi:hypothetical protein EV361DRAFT_315036 [Lentinula raphanica]|uniref:Yeast cell wall synthesis Kre9/Knh1-like N-terminal domain-containing protein n=1 Tax=Lentinula raphanica TaxID=153919 RepID=A0AA38P4W0_9AGAR|nr:hypothetical protein C8R42DRAFT_716961 [Lentinula raphanica]KAJ3836373.1 hypothetical protein F5878DRAFT_711480 [Lentinula raphanica]KAJ3969981.1 hypothetical protein EV361DRAFT_315036 [Lentinula raphanica]